MAGVMSPHLPPHLQHHQLAVAVAAALLLSVTVVLRLTDRWRHANRAHSLGCKPAYRVRNCLPPGIDFIMDTMKAGKQNRLPQALLKTNQDAARATFTLSVLGSEEVITSDPKNVQALLALQFKDFELGPQRRLKFQPMLGNGIFTADGKAWEHSRALLRPQFSRDQVSDLDMEERHVQHLFAQLPDDGAGWTAQVDLAPLFFRLTMDTATEFLFGLSTNSQLGHGRHVPPEPARGLDWSQVAQSFDRGTATLAKRTRLQGLYWAWHPRSFRDDCRHLNAFADYCIGEAAKRRNANAAKSPAPPGRYIFLDRLLDVTQDVTEIRSQLLNIFLAGRDTTAGLLSWTAWCLARHPHVWASLRTAILAHFGAGHDGAGSITFASLKACAPLQHVLSEVLRLYPSVPFNGRQATRDTSLPRGGGHDEAAPVYVRKGQSVSYSTYVMHRRPELWGADAHLFNPDRWQRRKIGWEYLPFNGGPRVCLGQNFALTVAAYVLVRLLQRFDRVDCLDPENEPLHQFSLTSAPKQVLVRLHGSA